VPLRIHRSPFRTGPFPRLPHPGRGAPAALQPSGAASLDFLRTCGFG